MKENNVEIKTIRKMRLKAKLLNLSLDEKENTVTFSTVWGIRGKKTSGVFRYNDNRWAYYQPFLKETLEKAFDEELEVELTVHRVARIVGRECKETKDIIMKAEIVEEVDEHKPEKEVEKKTTHRKFSPHKGKRGIIYSTFFPISLNMAMCIG